MTLLRYVRFSSREKFGLFIAVAFFIAGIYVSFVCRDAAMLGRFGACIIIVGVIFAITDLPKKLEERAKKMVDLKLALRVQSVIDAIEETEHRTLSEAERNKLSAAIHREEKALYERQVSLPTRRFLLVEATIVCFGTFVNGWGEWVLRHFFTTFQ